MPRAFLSAADIAATTASFLAPPDVPWSALGPQQRLFPLLLPKAYQHELIPHQQGLFTRRPSLARMAICSSGPKLGSLSFSPSSRYFCPLVLKKLFKGRLDLSTHAFSSSAEGLSSLISRYW